MRHFKGLEFLFKLLDRFQLVGNIECNFHMTGRAMMSMSGSRSELLDEALGSRKPISLPIF
jgi:hypothetical protein